MHRVFYGRDKYHLHEEMIRWCREHIGPGGWQQGVELAGQDASNWKWYVSTTFGNTEFEFVNKADAAAFEEYWDDRNDNRIQGV